MAAAIAPAVLPVSSTRRARRTGQFVLAAALACGPAAAQDLCRGAVTQQDLNECSHAAYLLADEELNRAYAAAREAAQGIDQGSNGQAEATLRVAQRAWVAFRDAACEAEAAFNQGGSIQPMIRSGCLERLTDQRTDDLWAYAER
ncbi:MAG TPA: lysozyme inhibitor LprI family protein [Rubellimicrobium sp.]|jgi:uncharacterized protein YecT (DUF1311 family)|nr:lysozyme inhibitor LprI family protein [Rubellimicrobium sp.]